MLRYTANGIVGIHDVIAYLQIEENVIDVISTRYPP